MNYSILNIKSDFLSCNCYIIKYESMNIIVDPCINVLTLQNNNINNIDAILITHCHVDHILYLQEIVEKFGCCVYLSKNCFNNIYDDNINLSTMFNFPLNIKKDSFKYCVINDGEDLIFDKNLKIHCMFTPGHSNCSVCYFIENDLFTGDLLFDGNIGRTDFPTGNFLTLLNSLKKIVNDDVDYTIYPGHGHSSTITKQKNTNVYFKYIEEV